MGLALIDWVIIVVYLVFSTAIAFRFSKRAGTNLSEYFLSGRALPWWIAGTTMVATTFAADTPLAVTELVAKNGIAGNWFWWNMLIGGMVTVFFFARLWRRAGIMTDVEFVDLRYSGKSARFLRGFRAIYIGIFLNIIIMGWVNLAMEKVLSVMFPDLTFFGLTGINFLGFQFSAHLLIVGAALMIVAVYSSMSGLWGVAITDMVQFALAMIGSVVLAIVALNIPEVGGIDGLKAVLPESTFRFLPTIGDAVSSDQNVLTISIASFIAFVGVQWWASWYPGAEPGGGGYVAQRMMSAKDERHSVLATLWFMVAHYALRPWPWIIVGLVSLVLFPDLSPADSGKGFVLVMKNYLPPGLVGLLLATFLAAFMSTISTQLNWGTSYIINDFYLPFFSKNRKEQSVIKVSRITTILMMIVSLFATTQMTRISDAWAFIIECSAGIGLVLIFRWFWWRINAWSEIAAMVTPLVIYPLIRGSVVFPETLFVIVAFSTEAWLITTIFSRPCEMAKLESFYRRVRPGGFWKPVAERLPDVKPDTGYGYLFLAWLFGVVAVYSLLFGFGSLVLKEWMPGLMLMGLAVISGYGVYGILSTIGWETVSGTD